MNDGHDDLVARPDAERPQRDRERVGAVGHADAVPHAADSAANSSSKASTSGPRM